MLVLFFSSTVCWSEGYVGGPVSVMIFLHDCFQETQEDDTNENLNLTAGHIVSFLQKGRK